MRSDLLILNERPRISSTAGPSGSPNAMDILPHVHGDVVADDVRDMADINSAGYEIRADEAKSRAVY